MSKFEEFKSMVIPDEIVFSITMGDILHVLQEMSEKHQDILVDVLSPDFIANKIAIDWEQEVKDFLEVQVDIISVEE